MGNSNFHIDVSVDDGKYRFTQDVEGHSRVFRHGEPWIEGGFPGVNMVIAMACELEEARTAVEDAAKRTRTLELFQAMADYVPRVALAQLWEMLGVENQTAAVTRLTELLAREKSR